MPRGKNLSQRTVTYFTSAVFIVVMHLSNLALVERELHLLFTCELSVDAVSANFEEDVVATLREEFECGIYCGWASVDNGHVYKMVMSVGFNPFYNNTKKTMVCISCRHPSS